MSLEKNIHPHNSKTLAKGSDEYSPVLSSACVRGISLGTPCDVPYYAEFALPKFSCSMCLFGVTELQPLRLSLALLFTKSVLKQAPPENQAIMMSQRELMNLATP